MSVVTMPPMLCGSITYLLESSEAETCGRTFRRGRETRAEQSRTAAEQKLPVDLRCSGHQNRTSIDVLFWKARLMSRIAVAVAGFCIVLTGLTDVGFAQAPKKPMLIPEWGEVISPPKGFKYKVQDEGLKLTLPSAAHDLSIEINRMNAPRILQPVQGDFSIQVKVSGVTHPGNQSVIPGRKPFCGAGLLVWQNERNYVRLERAALLNGGTLSTYASWELRQNAQFVRQGRADEMPLTGADTWLRITRSGDTFSGEVSANGQDWKQLPAITLAGSTRDLKVGILAVNVTQAPFMPQFSELSLKPATQE